MAAQGTNTRLPAAPVTPRHDLLSLPDMQAKEGKVAGLGCRALLSVSPTMAVWTSTLLDDAKDKQGQMWKVKSKPQGDGGLPPTSRGPGFSHRPSIGLRNCPKYLVRDRAGPRRPGGRRWPRRRVEERTKPKPLGLRH